MRLNRWLLLLGLLASQMVRAVSPLSTEVNLYRPFQITTKAGPILDGVCGLRSNVDHRADAWRCTSGSTVYDPCFVKTFVDKNHLVCPTSPWVGLAVTIKTKQPLINEGRDEVDMSQDAPWAIELTDGTQCKKQVSPQAHYRCNNDGVLLGKIRRCKGLWSTFWKRNDSEVLKKVDIARVWY